MKWGTDYDSKFEDMRTMKNRYEDVVPHIHSALTGLSCALDRMERRMEDEGGNENDDRIHRKLSKSFRRLGRLYGEIK